MIALGQNAGRGLNQNNRFVIDNDCLPAFTNHAAAVAAFAGAPGGMTYLYYETPTNTVKAVRT